MFKKIINQRFISALASFVLLFQTFFSPVLYLLPAPVAASEPQLETKISFDQGKNSFNLSVNTQTKVEYLLAYRTPEKTEAVTGTTDENNSSEFSREIYAGTCSSDGSCVPHQVLRGILKVKVASENWLDGKKFVLENGELKVVEENTPSTLELNDQENYWLENGEEFTPTVTLTPTNTPTPIEQGQILDGLSTQATPTPTVTVDNQNKGQLTATIIDDPSTYVSPSILNLFTDKPDYAPTEKVIITGSGFTPNTRYELVITSDGLYNNTYIYTGMDGSFLFTYQLDGVYRPNYKVEAKDLTGSIIASTTFTDTCSVGKYDIYGKIKTDGYTKGNLCSGSGDCWSEDDEIPARLTITGLTVGDDYSVTIQHDYMLNGVITGYEEFKSPSSGNLTADNVILSPASIVDCGANTTCKNYNLSFTAQSNDVQLDWLAKLGVTASQWSGGSLHFRLLRGVCDESIGSKDIPINPQHIVITGSITPIKSPANNANPSDWTFDITGNTNINDITSGTKADNLALNTNNGDATYTITESGPSGWILDSVDCDYGSPSVIGSSVTVTLTSTNPDVSCTFVNEQTTGSLTVIKNVVGGLATANQWKMHIHDSTGTDAVTPFDGAESPGVANALKPATYKVEESDGPSGYTLSYSGDCTSDGSVTIVSGQTKTCTLTNTKDIATLIVKKVIKNDNGGNNDYPDFSFSVNNGIATAFDTDGQNELTVDPGFYTVTEPSVTGYNTSYNNCENINIPKDGTVTCTITNDDIAPTVTLIKNIVKDDGGTAGENDFGLTVGGNPANSGVAVQVMANTPVAIDETGLSGYKFVSITGEGCPSALGETVSLALGQNITCTITNDDIAPKLTLIKTLIKNNGGNASQTEWILNATGTERSFSGTTPVTKNVKAGVTYTLSESGPSGYEAGSWSCNGGNQTDDQIVLGLADEVTCTITNDDIAPTLKLVKSVTNNNGGNNFSYEAILSATGDELSFSDNGAAGTFHVVKANIPYILSETFVSGYTGGEWSCDRGVLSGNVLTLSLDENVTCTIGNIDQPAKITLTKIVNNNYGGNAQPDDFSLTIDGNTVLSGSTTEVFSNITHSINETLLPGYEFVSITGDDKCPTVLGGTVSLDEGESISCTITNNAIQPKLTVNKIVARGEAAITDFDLYVDGTKVNSGEKTGFNAGTYTIREVNNSGDDYTGDIWCDGVHTNQISLVLGDDKECTITNSRDIGKITIRKNVDIDADGDYIDEGETNSTDWNWDIADVEQNILTGQSRTLPTNAYTITEVGKNNYHLDHWTCTNGTNGSINSIPIALNKDSDITCTFYNIHDTGSITVHKEVVASDLTDVDDDTQFTVKLDGVDPKIISETQNATYNNLLVGQQYTITEDPVTDYSFYSALTDEDLVTDGFQVTVQSGNNNLIITNKQNPGSIQGKKYADVNGNGTLENSEKTNPNNQLNDWRIFLYDSLEPGSSSVSMLTGSGGLAKGQYRFNNLPAGTYYVCEELKDGWVQTYPFDGPTVNGKYCHEVNLGVGENKVGVIFGNFQKGLIQGRKYNDSNINGVYDSGEEYLNDWTINLYKLGAESWVGRGSFQTGDTGTKGQYRFSNLEQGTYFVCESFEGYSGWVQSGPVSGTEVVDNLSPNKENEGGKCWQIVIDRSGETNSYKHFGNYQKGKITVTKYRDKDQDGAKDTNEKVLDGWTINLSGQESQVTDGEGKVIFDNLLAGDYTLSENLKNYWHQSNISCGDEIMNNNNSHTVTVSPGADIQCTIGNYRKKPKMTLNKTNNRLTTDQSPGGNVLYTLTVEVFDSPILDAILTDLLPGGFKYRGGSWTALLNRGGTITDLKANGTVLEPSYASPGTWELGDLKPGDVVTLTYLADIDNSQQPGLYKDLTWVKGTDEDEGASDLLVLGNADSNIFVGTQVNVVKDQQNSISTKIVKEQKEEVLGATTGLPSTGGKTLWVILASILVLLGALLVIMGVFLKKRIKLPFMKLLKGMFLAGAVFIILGAKSVSAAPGDLTIRVEHPKSPTNQNNFKLNFVALDITNRPITVKCYKQKAGEGSFSQFGSDINLTNGGNTGDCQVDSSIINGKALYDFKVIAYADADSAESETVTVDYNGNEGPSAPTSYHKEKTSSCSYKITFKTADDNGKTVKVEVYRSDLTEFTANDGTRVQTITIGSNQDGSFEDNVPDCGKDYYYVIRAFDTFGNGSDIVGDSVVKTVTTTILVSPTAAAGGAIPVTNVTISGGEQVLGEKEASREAGEVKGEKTAKEKKETPSPLAKLASSAFAPNNRIFIVILGVLIFGIIFYVFRKRSKSE